MTEYLKWLKREKKEALHCKIQWFIFRNFSDGGMSERTCACGRVDAKCWLLGVAAVSSKLDACQSCDLENIEYRILFI